MSNGILKSFTNGNVERGAPIPFELILRQTLCVFFSHRFLNAPSAIAGIELLGDLLPWYSVRGSSYEMNKLVARNCFRLLAVYSESYPKGINFQCRRVP